MRITRTILKRTAYVLPLTILYPLLFLSCVSYGQIFDNFLDGNLTQNPTWLGDTSLFLISSSSAVPPELKPALKLNGNTSDTTVIAVPNSLFTNVEWRFWVKHSFNSSANNFSRFYLVSDQSDLAGPLNGYFVQMGGADDSLLLCKQEGLATSVLITGSSSWFGSSTNSKRIKVTRNDEGLWKLFSCEQTGYEFLLEGGIVDTTWLETMFCGLYLKYTQSNASKFYFDDIYLDEMFADTLAPEVMQLDVLSTKKVLVVFSEPMDPYSALNPDHYYVDPQIGHPAYVNFDESLTDRLLLTFDNAFTGSLNYHLEIDSVMDYYGNFLVGIQIPFNYMGQSPAQAYDILINEVMADVSPPPNELPAADYLELFNTTSDTIHLEGFTLQPRELADPISFSNIDLLPDSFLIITHVSDTSLFLSYGPVAGLPGFSLNNEGLIVLRNEEGKLIHALFYTKEWYKEDYKKEGGWAIEQIDPLRPCSGIVNWRASQSPAGGTPGMVNSVDGIMVSMPGIQSIRTLDNNRLKIDFTHYMDSLSIQKANNYSVNENLGTPLHSTMDEVFFNHLFLEFENAFIENKEYELTLNDTLFDCSGQAMVPGLVYSFVHPRKALPYEVVINEVFPDPDPPVGLPAFEYLELFNTTDDHLEVRNWILEVGTTQKSIPDFILFPSEYVILTEKEGALIYSLYGRVFGLSSLGLNNSGTTIKFIDQEGILMSSITYDHAWFFDENKAEGGYSLEQIDPYNPCSEAENWGETQAEKGGTPGSLNSLDAFNPVSLQIENVFVSDEAELEVRFNQTMDAISVSDPLRCIVNMGIGEASEVVPLDDVYQVYRIGFDKLFQREVIYTLTLKEGIYNCIGVQAPTAVTFDFGVAEDPLERDVVINEVLFNPVGEGVDFVEIYNRSSKIIDLKSISLGQYSLDALGFYDTIWKNTPSEHYLLLPGHYKVLTKDPQKIMEQYYTPNPDGFLKMEEIPLYKNESGNVLLSAPGGELVDIMNYEESMHHPLLTTSEGVSLERIHYDRPSADPTNWHSSSSQAGYATPGYENSQFAELSYTSSEISIQPEVFSPDNDGYQDVALINYNFGKPGYIATIVVYNSNGYPVKVLVNHDMLGASGSYSWDGLNENQNKAPIGIYLILFEVYDLEGNQRRYKETVVLAGER